MKKITLAIVSMILFTGIAQAQLLPQFSQYMFVDYILNPAIGGTHDYWQVKSNNRYQWAGVKDAPQTYLLGAYGPHKTLPMGYGGYIFNDIMGPVSNMGLFGSYAYNISISSDIRLSMGLFAGIIQQKVDLSSIGFNDPDEPLLLLGENTTKIYPDASIGLYLYTSQYYVGFSFNHLFFNNMSLLQDMDESEGITDDRLKPHFFVQGGYKYNINRNFDLEPTILMKSVPSYDFMTDLHVRAIFKKMVWGGLGFRYNFKNPEALIFLVGYNYNDIINIGYSYDFTLSKLNYSSNGSHEILIGVKFADIRKSRSKRKIR